MLRYLILILLFFHSIAVHAQTRGGDVITSNEAMPGNVYAVVVGVSKYDKMNGLKYADEDAKLFSRFLLSPAGGNTPPENIKIYLNKEAVGTAIEISAIQWLNERHIKKGDRIYFFLAGHGANKRNKFYFMSSDADTITANHRVQGNLEIFQLKESLQDYIQKGAEVFLIIDACRTNESSSTADKERADKFAQISKLRDNDLPSFHTLYATREGAPAFESKDIGRGHGIFTYYLVDGLFGKADNEAGGDKNGYVTLLELGTWLKTSVPKKSDTLFKSRQLPDYCCTANDDRIITKVDSAFFRNYDSIDVVFESLLRDTTNISTSINIAKRDRFRTGVSMELLGAYDQFNEEIKTGSLSAAESVLRTMMAKWPAHEFTQDARINLLSEYIIYAQARINLYLSGFDVSYVKKMNDNYKLGNKKFIEMQRISLINFGQAATYMEKAIQLVRNDAKLIASLQPRLWFLRARSYFDSPKSRVSNDEAIQLTNKALAQDTGAAHLYFLLGMLEQEKNQNSAVAEKYFLKALAAESKWSKANLEIGYLYYKLGRYNLAEQYYRRSENTAWGQANAYNNIAILFESQQKFADAEIMYNKAVEMSPSDSVLKWNLSNYYNERGLEYNKLKDYKKAEEYYLKSIQTDTDYLESYINIANNYFQTKEYSKAEPYYLKALEFKDKRELTLYNMGMCYYEAGDYRKAKKAFEDCIAASDCKCSNSFYPVATRYRDESIKMIGKTYVRITYNGKVVTIDTTKAPMQIAKEFLSVEQPAQAEIYLLKELEHNQTNPEVFQHLAKIKQGKKEFDKAELYYWKWMSLDSSDEKPYLQLGNYFIIRKKYSEAETVFLMYYNKYPKNRKILNQLIRVYSIMDKQKEVKRFQKEYSKSF